MAETEVVKEKEEKQGKEKETVVPSKRKSGRKKVKRTVAVGLVYIRASFNNTIVTITDTQGSVISWGSSGLKGFKGSRKGTPYAAGLAADEAIRKAMDMGLRTVSVKIKGPGAGRESALRSLQASGLRVTTIDDVTPIPHNGCRPSKRRRI